MSLNDGMKTSVEWKDILKVCRLSKKTRIVEDEQVNHTENLNEF